MSPHVKRRTYDASKRRADALARRAGILAVARELFLRDGFAGTTAAAVAQRAGVSQETVYKHFGGKSGLVRALHDSAMRGDGPMSPYRRADNLRGHSDPDEIVLGWSRLAMEVSPRVSPILLLVRDAALVQPRLRDLLTDLDEERHLRMSENAQFLHDAGHLRKGLTAASAADVMWSVTSPEMYELLVLRRGWSLDHYGDHIFLTISCLLESHDTREPPAHGEPSRRVDPVSPSRRGSRPSPRTTPG